MNLLEVAIAVAAFVVGSSVHQWLGVGLWFIPLSMLPGFIWIWFRVENIHCSMWTILILTGGLSVYFAVKDALWPNPPDWSFAIDLLICYVLTFGADLIRRLRAVACNGQP